MTDLHTTLTGFSFDQGQRRRAWIDFSAVSAAARRRFVSLSLMVGDCVAMLLALRLLSWLDPAADVPLAVIGNFSYVLACALLVSIFLFLELYTGIGPGPIERFRLRLLGTLYFVVTYFALIYFVTAYASVAGPAPNEQLLLCAVATGISLLIAGHFAEVTIRSLLVYSALWGARTVLVGCGQTSRNVCASLLSQPELGLNPIGFVVPHGGSVQADPPLPLLGRTADVSGLRPEIEVVIITSPRQQSEFEAAYATTAAGTHVPRLIIINNAAHMRSLRLATRSLGCAVAIELDRNLYSRKFRTLKRGMDLAFAIPAAILALPVILALAALVKLCDFGPSFYTQERVGRKGQILKIIKIRTMYQDAEKRLESHLRANPSARAEWNRFYKLSDDPRVLPVIGRFIRRWSLDELPQLWNVIRGDMSLVGPRPFPAYHLSSFDETFRTIRSSVRPGLTGLWQISSRSDGDLNVQKTEDLFYICNISIWLDIYVLLQTLPAVLSAKGAR